jgi:O-antigen/teichoic acid export membrane protein
MVGGGMQLRRNLTQSLVKLALLAVFAVTLSKYSSLTIFASWFIANVVSLAAMAAVLVRRFRVPLRNMIPSLSSLHGLKVAAIKHHGLNIALFVPYFAMPVVANAVLGPEKSGYFFAAWSLAGFVMFLPFSLATALFASGSRDSDAFLTGFRHTLRYSMVICLIANIGIWVLGKPALSVFGSNYGVNAYHALLATCLGCFGLVIKDHHVALARIKGTVGRESLLIGALSCIEIAAAAVGAHRGGITGLGIGWLAATLLEALVCGWLVVRTYRSAG